MTGADVRMHPNLLRVKVGEGIKHEFRGEQLTVPQISKLTGIGHTTLYSRLRRGQPLDETRSSRLQAKRYEFRGQQMTVAEIVNLTGLSRSTIYEHISGQCVLEGQDLIDRDRDPHPLSRMIFHRGKRMCISEWAEHLQMDESTIRARLRRGWSVERTLTTPADQAQGHSRRARNRRAIKAITRRFRSVRNRLLIHRIASTFHAHTGAWSSSFQEPSGTGLGSFAVERGQIENPIPTENRRASA